MLPKTGNNLPNNNGRRDMSSDYASVMAMALQNELGRTHQAVKTAMQWTGASESTVKNWLSGARGPSGTHLVALANHSDEVLEVFLALAGREEARVVQNLIRARDQLREVVEQLDRLALS